MSDVLFHSIEHLFKLKPESFKAIARLRIYNLRDLLFYRPLSYQIKDINPNLSKLQHGQLIQTEVVINEVTLSTKRHRPTKILASNDTGSILLVFFNKIPPFIFNRLTIGSKHVISGKVQFFDFYYQISHPEFISNTKLNSALEPIYPLTYALTNKQLYSYILQGLGIAENQSKNDNVLIELLFHLKTLHLYKVNISPSEIDKKWAESIKFLAAKELFAHQSHLAQIRGQKHSKNGRSITKNLLLQNAILAQLNFTLTNGQTNALSEIEKDQLLPMQMTRLLQGDVGSGKTLVALLSMINTASIGHQTVLMAPTDLLANQHYQFFSKALKNSDKTLEKLELLTGKTKTKERKKIFEELETGVIKILIGTHALFQEKVNFKELAYIVIDEQHRFGVKQRLSLISKASHPDVLVMTATPIPRSLTLTMFGDMDVSRLTEKPKHRLPIITSIVSQNKVNEVIVSLSKKIASEERIYWICPIIEQADIAVEQTKFTDIAFRFKELEFAYPGIVGLIHGKMPPEQKDEVMLKFKNGENKILVATTVIEVGIDVPEATLIIIENAEKFGLAQLHQLRGRVGRGPIQSYCIMIYNPKNLSQTSKKRLEIIKSSEDGFFIAEQDLILRGSGDLLGVKQSGEPEFFFADLARDTNLLIEANKRAAKIKINESIIKQIKLFERHPLF